MAGIFAIDDRANYLISLLAPERLFIARQNQRYAAMILLLDDVIRIRS